jgi:hypothetical protein
MADALVSAFPTKNAFERMVLYVLDFHLEHKMSLDAGLEDLAFKLIKLAEEEHTLHRLVAGAAQERPDHAALKACKRGLEERGGQRPLQTPAPRKPGGSLPAVWANGFAQFCDREPQWREIEARGYLAWNELVFVPGARKQGHEYLLKRIRQRPDIDPKSVVEVDPLNAYVAPTCRGEWLTMLGAALKVVKQGDPPTDVETLQDRIADELARQLSERPILLVHPTIAKDFCDDIRSYYTEWLPGVLRHARAKGELLNCVKVYQAIAWRPPSWADRVRSWFGIAEATAASRNDLTSANRLMAGIVAAQKADVLRVRQLPTMTDINDDDLVMLCRYWAIEDPDKHADLVRECSTAATSSDKLETADLYLPKLLQANPTDLPR